MDKILYLSQKKENSLKDLKGYIQRISSIEEVRDSESLLVLDEDQLPMINTMNVIPFIFIRIQKWDIKKIQDISSKIPLAGVIDNQMSSQNILQLIKRKSGWTPHISDPLVKEVAYAFNRSLTEICFLCQKWIKRCQKGYKGSPNFLSDIREVKIAATRCQQIVKTFSEFSKNMETPVAFSLTHLVQTTLSLLEPTLRPFHCHLDIQACYDTVWGRPDLLRQVISNIIRNACQASKPKDSLHIKIYAKDHLIYLEVQDFGRGIPKKDLSKIFDPFFTTKKKGVGLGLNLCQKIIHRMKGKTNVESEMGKGTTVQIQLNQYFPDKN